jgi:hypothetical protein
MVRIGIEDVTSQLPSNITSDPFLSKIEQKTPMIDPEVEAIE